MEKIKILQIVPSLSQANGVAAYITTYFENMKKDNIEMTFLVLNDRDHSRYENIRKNGGKIIELYKCKNIIKYIKNIKKFFEDNKYDIVHCHVPNYGAIYLRYAKKYKVPVRILHSHESKGSDRVLNRIRNFIINPITRFYANAYIACSEVAGKFLFHNKKFHIINNAIDIEKYKYSKRVKEKYEKEFNLKDKFVIGEFGRLCTNKNQLFTLDIFYEILKVKKNAILMLVGNGNMKDVIYKKICKMGIKENVIMLGSRKDVNKLYNILDVFLLPSISEGLGIVLIEAQANGIICFTSDKVVPLEAKVTPLLNYISLDRSSKFWCDEIISKYKNKRIDYKNEISQNGFDIRKESNKLYELYCYFMKNR